MSKLGYETLISDLDAFMAAYMEDKSEEGRRNHESHINGVSSSSSSSSRMNIDLNELPLDYDREEPQNICWSLSLFRISYNTLKTLTTLTTPDAPQSSTSKGKRPLLVKERSSKKRAKTKHEDSSSSSSRMINIDLNEVPDDSVSEEPESSKSQRKKKAKKARPKAALEVDAINSSPPVWLVQVMRNINGAEDPRLIFVKNLKAADVDHTQSRLLIPFKLIRNDFLTEVESRYLEGQGGDKEVKKPRMEATLVNERSEKWGLNCKIWYMNDNGYYVLNGGWNEFVSANGLRLGHEINLWSFRCQGTLCFALLNTTPTID